MNALKPRYGQTILYLLLLLMVVCIMAGTKRCSSSPLLPPTATGDSGGDTIDVGIVYGPMSYFIYEDTLGGLNYDLLRLFESQNGRALKFWPIVSLDEAQRRLETGKYDLLASLPLDNSVKQRFATTSSIFLDRLVLVQLTDSFGIAPISSALDLGSDTVFLQKNSPALERIKNLSKEIGIEIPVVPTADLSEEYLCMKVAAGDIRLAVVNEKTASRMKEKFPLLSYDNPISFTQFQIWIMNRDNENLSSEINPWLDSIKTTPTFKNLMKRYIRNEE